MLWKILRVRIWTLDRSIRAAPKAALLAGFMALMLLGQVVITRLLPSSLRFLAADEFGGTAALAIPYALFLLLLFGMMGVGDILHHLFLAPDVELLLTAPLRPQTIFLAKCIDSSRAMLIPGIAIGGYLLLVGAAHGAGWVYSLLILFFLLLLILIATLSMVLLVLLLVRFLPVDRVRAWFPVAVSVLMVSLVFVQQHVLSWFAERTALARGLIDVVHNPIRILPWLGGFVLGALVLTILTEGVFRSAYQEGWSRYHEVPLSKKGKRERRFTFGMKELTDRLPESLRWVCYKDWLDMSRNPRAWINIMQPLVMVLIVVGPMLVGDADQLVVQLVSFWSLILFLLVFLSTIPLGLPLLSLAEEGQSFVLLRSMPVPMGAVLRAKAWNIGLPLVAAWIFVLTGTSLLLHYSRWQLLILIFLCVWSLSMNVLIGLVLGALSIDFSAEDLKQRMKGWISYLIMGLSLGYTFLSMGMGLWINLRLVDTPGLSLVLGTFRDMGWMPWMWSGSWLPFLGMLSGLTFYWFALVVAWRWAVRRLERWEPV